MLTRPSSLRAAALMHTDVFPLSAVFVVIVRWQLSWNLTMYYSLIGSHSGLLEYKYHNTHGHARRTHKGLLN